MTGEIVEEEDPVLRDGAGERGDLLHVPLPFTGEFLGQPFLEPMRPHGAELTERGVHQFMAQGKRAIATDQRVRLDQHQVLPGVG